MKRLGGRTLPRISRYRCVKSVPSNDWAASKSGIVIVLKWWALSAGLIACRGRELGRGITSSEAACACFQALIQRLHMLIWVRGTVWCMLLLESVVCLEYRLWFQIKWPDATVCFDGRFGYWMSVKHLIFPCWICLGNQQRTSDQENYNGLTECVVLNNGLCHYFIIPGTALWVWQRKTTRFVDYVIRG